MSDIIRFTKENSLIVVIDIQDKLAATMKQKDEVIKNIKKLIKTANTLSIPMLVTEQYPEGLGKTVIKIWQLIDDVEPVEKTEFSCSRVPEFTKALEDSGRKNIILTGMESHVCVMQTALDLLEKGYNIGVVGDAVCSYGYYDKTLAMQRMSQAGAVVISTEMLIFELLEKAGTEDFKSLNSVIKDR